jgi:bacteriocin-like protein
MNKKKLMPQTTQPINPITIQGLATQFVELSDKDLQKIVGGFAIPRGSGYPR